MRPGYLSEFFSGVAAKRLSAVEASSGRSHQHEFNGVNDLVRLFGKATAKQVFPAKLLYLSDDEDRRVAEEASVTWYDSRLRHPVRTEHRLYYPASQISSCAAEGDLLFVGKLQEGTVLVVIAQGDSTIANQLEWLFGTVPPLHLGFVVREELETDRDRIEFASALILEQIGIVVETTEPAYLDAMLARFGTAFPPTRTFSAFARSTQPDVRPQIDPDLALMSWMEREEVLFRTLEKHLIADRLQSGFANDVEGFLQFSLSVQNRRKSRVGLALENHLEEILRARGIAFERAVRTDGKARPDFLFPGGRQYQDPSFPSHLLTMLGVKSTCKDRWRQVLAEAKRIESKHLLTLETAISRDQLCQMKDHDVQLVVPRKLHTTYCRSMASSLLDVASFLQVVESKAARAFACQSDSASLRAPLEQ